MRYSIIAPLILGGALVTCSDASAQMGMEAPATSGSEPLPRHDPMFMTPLGSWNLMGMGQVFPTVTIGAPGRSESPLRETGLYLTQPVIMGNLESSTSRIVFRTTLNFEVWTQRDGELTFGGWGEGFLDSRHPHSILHEVMVSLNSWNPEGGGYSVSVGRGFVPYGTDDPMSRPALKYPTNHHLSQILERWTANGIYDAGGWSVEAGVFGGAEPTDPWDMSNIRTFGDSYAGRLTLRPGRGTEREWEVSASAGSVREEHHGDASRTTLLSVALRHEHRSSARDALYWLIEGSQSRSEGAESYASVLAEGQMLRGVHRPYLRVEYATRPEFPREGAGGTEGFFRYDHDDHSIGATRWLISTAGYGLTIPSLPVGTEAFLEVQNHQVSHERGPSSLEPALLIGAGSFFAVSAGFRLTVGGRTMRMGSYGVLDPMSRNHRPRGTGPSAPGEDAVHQH